MRVIVTGAGGFVGAVLNERLKAAVPHAHIVGVDVACASTIDLTGDLADPRFRAAMIGDGVDVLIHLAAIPGGAAERDPSLSRRINLDATLALFDVATASGRRPRIVYASTVAVLGDNLPAIVTDETPLRPAMTYGAHKLMVEVALADLHRRGRADAVSLRLPGIVARPPAPSGLKSAFLSDIFYAHAGRRDFVCPVSAEGRTWLMSVDRCVENIIFAATADMTNLPASRAVTLPALRVRIGDLVDTLAAREATQAGSVTYRPDTSLERTFASHPPLVTEAAKTAGFDRDASLDELVDRVLARIASAT